MESERLLRAKSSPQETRPTDRQKAQELLEKRNRESLDRYICGRGSAGGRETTLGELIVALTEEAHRVVTDETELYEVVAYLVSERLAVKPHRDRALQAALRWSRQRA